MSRNKALVLLIRSIRYAMESGVKKADLDQYGRYVLTVGTWNSVQYYVYASNPGQPFRNQEQVESAYSRYRDGISVVDGVFLGDTEDNEPATFHRFGWFSRDRKKPGRKLGMRPRDPNRPEDRPRMFRIHLTKRERMIYARGLEIPGEEALLEAENASFKERIKENKQILEMIRGR